MDQHDVEPILRRSIRRLQHSHPPMPQLPIQPRVLDVADTVEGELGVSLLEEYRRDDDAALVSVGSVFVCEEVGLAKVVHEPGDGEDVDGGECARLEESIEIEYSSRRGR
jgi:hypothetical protein